MSEHPKLNVELSALLSTGVRHQYSTANNGSIMRRVKVKYREGDVNGGAKGDVKRSVVALHYLHEQQVPSPAQPHFEDSTSESHPRSDLKPFWTMQSSWSWFIKVESSHLVTVTSVLISRAMLLEPNEDFKRPI